MTTAEQPNKIHHGRNIKRFREMRGIKQEALALELGEDWSQKKVSRLEDNEVIEDEILESVGKALGVSSNAIKTFTEQAALSIISTFNKGSVSHVIANYGTYNLNDTEKIVELYERMLNLEREKIAVLEKLLSQKK